jgi:hypothetical protein
MVSPNIIEKRCQTKNSIISRALDLEQGSRDLEALERSRTADLLASTTPGPEEQAYLGRRCGIKTPMVGRLDKGKMCRKAKGPFSRTCRAPTEHSFASRLPGETSRQIFLNTLQDSGGKRRMCYHFCYQFRQLFRISTSSKSTWRRGKSNPCPGVGFGAAPAPSLLRPGARA